MPTTRVYVLLAYWEKRERVLYATCAAFKVLLSARREVTQLKSMGSPIPEWFDSTQTRSGEGLVVRCSQAQ